MSKTKTKTDTKQAWTCSCIAHHYLQTTLMIGSSFTNFRLQCEDIITEKSITSIPLVQNLTCSIIRVLINGNIFFLRRSKMYIV